jgi:hypothetical protein
MRGSKPGEVRFEISFVHGKSTLHDTPGDGPGDRAAMFAPLHHHGYDILRVIKRCIRCEPSDGIFVAPVGRLSRAGFAGHLHVIEVRGAAGPAIFIHDFPKTFTHEIDVGR